MIKKYFIASLSCFALGLAFIFAQAGMKSGVSLSHDESAKKVDVIINGQFFTSYIYPEDLMKPVLYPVMTPAGTKVTRNYPLDPSKPERSDHPHHVGLWFNYGDVNGLDFWNHSNRVSPEKKDRYGTIVHRNIKSMEETENTAHLDVEMDWLAPDKKILLKEETRFTFHATKKGNVIDRITTLTAQSNDISFKDNKEGMIAIRLTRELEHPSRKPVKVAGAEGTIVIESEDYNKGVTGKYLNSEGVEGGACWGKRAKWVNLSGEIKDEAVSIIIMDHPDNVGYPTYWHARTYGLFSANPLGQAIFSKGEEELNFALKAGESVTFRHRIVVSNDQLEAKQINKSFNQFAKSY